MQELFTFTPYASGDGLNLSAAIIDGQPWFIAADVCRSLEIKNASHAMARLDSDEKALQKCMTLGGAQQAYIINESGLYALVCGSNKEGARRFRKWITSVVLPSIRKHGGYINGQEALSQEAQEEILPQLHNVVSTARERAQEERDARYNAFQVLKSFGSRKRVRRPATNR